MSTSLQRRTFLAHVAALTPACLTRRASGAAAERLNIAAVGVAGKGASDLRGVAEGHNVVALCDVDENSLRKAAELYPRAKKYFDWRRLLEQQDIDALTVSTPDHMHAPIAVSAMQLGKHVYVQKPLAHTLFEARQMRRLAEKYGVVTQMGNQHHSGANYRTLVEVIQGGAIGKIREAFAWSDRPIWPQGITRPTRTDTPPESLHWDLWLGVAPQRPFVAAEPGSKRGRGAYHPFNWRGWLDFGVGALGDMGCHIIDPVVWSLELGAPSSVRSAGPESNGETYPEWEKIRYEFAGTRYTAGPKIGLTWFDGGKQPPAEVRPSPDTPLPKNGSMYVGEKGTIVCPHGRGKLQLFPEDDFADFEIPEVPGDDHYQQWANACRGLGKTTSNFNVAVPLTETVLLGTIAIRFPQQSLEWDSQALSFTNQADANQYLHHAYREGWQVPELSG